MSAATISVNKKLADGTLISVGGTSFSDFATNVAGFVGDDGAAAIIGDVAEAILGNAPVRAADAVANVYREFPGTQVAPASPPPPAAPPTTVAAADSSAPHCAHGPRVFKTGGGGDTGKKAWKAWMCPAQKGDPTQCPPSWVR